MTVIAPAENEKRILHFHREELGEGVQVAHIAVRRGESSFFHHHTRTRDTFYVIGGKLTVTLRLREDQKPKDAYQALSATPASISHDVAGRLTHRLELDPGDVLMVEPGVVHCASNLHDDVCRFLCIEAVGEYDFILEGYA